MRESNGAGAFDLLDKIVLVLHDAEKIGRELVGGGGE